MSRQPPLQRRRLLAAIECATDTGEGRRFRRPPSAKPVNELILERGFISRAWNVLRFAPPLIVTRVDIDRMITVAEREHACEFAA